MTQQGIITIVHGYHVDTHIPEQAYKANLTFRFAIIFETAFQEHNASFFQSTLFIALLSAIKEQVDCNSLQVEVDENTRCRTFDLFKEDLFKVPADDRMPPQRIFFRKNDTLTCIEETEFWVLCGGPAPYSDSYTASFYTKDDMTDTFDAACAAVCLDMGAVIRERIQGSSYPVRSWWKKLRSAIEQYSIVRR